MDIPVTLRMIRTARNLTMVGASELVGVHPASWQRWESGESTPPADKVNSIREAFGLTNDQLAELVGSFKNPSSVTA